MKRNVRCGLAILFVIFASTEAFINLHIYPFPTDHAGTLPVPVTNSDQTAHVVLFSRNDNNDFDKPSQPLNNVSKPIDLDLVRPPINVRKESILFGENPATAKNNNISRLWLTLKISLPYIFTGVSKDEVSAVDDNPIGAIYNMIFVRFPSVLTGVVYSKNLIEGHPLYCDVGAGPIEIPPLFVYGVLLIILR